MGKVKKSVWLPALLLVYLAVMASIGWKDYASGRSTPTFYFGTIIVTVIIIILLHFNLKRREQSRARREKDINGKP